MGGRACTCVEAQQRAPMGFSLPSHSPLPWLAPLRGCPVIGLLNCRNTEYETWVCRIRNYELVEARAVRLTRLLPPLPCLVSLGLPAGHEPYLALRKVRAQTVSTPRTPSLPSYVAHPVVRPIFHTLCLSYRSWTFTSFTRLRYARSRSHASSSHASATAFLSPNRSLGSSLSSPVQLLRLDPFHSCLTSCCPARSYKRSNTGQSSRTLYLVPFKACSSPTSLSGRAHTQTESRSPRDGYTISHIRSCSPTSRHANGHISSVRVSRWRSRHS